MEQWGKETLIIDENEKNVRKARRAMPDVTSCDHDHGVSFLRDGQYEKVLISGDEGKALDAVSLAFIAANFSASRVGVLSSHGLLSVEIAECFFVVNATLVFFSNGGGKFGGDLVSAVDGEKNWYRFLELLTDSEPKFLVMPYT